jgi:hypothetical protein
MDYLDAFNNSECRACGRLKAENRRDLAVCAHGYLLLTPKQEAEVTARSGGVPFPPAAPGTHLDGGRNAWGRWEEHRGIPVRAIVKELATEHIGFGAVLPGELWRDLKSLHRLGILVRDLSAGNYIGGKLVDFGQSWTMPHPCFEYIHPDRLREEREADPLNLDCAIVDWQRSNHWKGIKVEIPQELRDCASGKGAANNGADQYGIDPRFYDWRKWEDDLDAVDAFHNCELYGPPEEGT